MGDAGSRVTASSAGWCLATVITHSNPCAEGHNAEVDQGAGRGSRPVSRLQWKCCSATPPGGEDVRGDGEQQPDLGPYPVRLCRGWRPSRGRPAAVASPATGEGQGAAGQRRMVIRDRQRYATGCRVRSGRCRRSAPPACLTGSGVSTAAAISRNSRNSSGRSTRPSPSSRTPEPQGISGELVLQQGRGHLEPGQVERLVAGNHEHLLVEGGAQALAGGKQLFWFNCKVIASLSKRVEFVVEPFEQLGTAANRVSRSLRSSGVTCSLGCWASRSSRYCCGVASLSRSWFSSNWSEAQVGDLVGQALIGLDLGQRLFLRGCATAAGCRAGR